jgi:L-amino acid N-acyltransferase YncA
MKKKLTLSDGSEVILRELQMDDFSRLMTFYRNLPSEDRRFLRIDVTKEDVVRKRLELMQSGIVHRIVALKDDQIIADGALELSTEEWRRNQAEMRVIVSSLFQRKGLGMLMMKELNELAMEMDVSLLVVKMMKPQVGARKITSRLGFRKKRIIPNYVVDMHGTPHDLLIMTRSVKDLWKEMDHLYQKSDWQRCR